MYDVSGTGYNSVRFAYHPAHECYTFIEDPHGRFLLFTAFVKTYRGVKAFIITGNENPYDTSCNSDNQPYPLGDNANGFCYPSCSSIDGTRKKSECPDYNIVDAEKLMMLSFAVRLPTT